jgi:protein-tyrosine phosphatase
MMKILFVCTGNVCRSPLGEGYLKSLLTKNGLNGVEVSSAGIAALVGAPPFECAMEVAQKHGFNISDHIARQITSPLIEDMDRIFCMESWQANIVKEMEPKRAKRVILLGSFHPNNSPQFQIPDPADFTVPETLITFDLIKPSIENFYASLTTEIAK